MLLAVSGDSLSHEDSELSEVEPNQSTELDPPPMKKQRKMHLPYF